MSSPSAAHHHAEETDHAQLLDEKLDLTDDQEALREGATELLDGYASVEQVRAFTDRDDPYDRELWAAMIEQGWLAIDVDESDGGLGFGAVEAGVSNLWPKYVGMHGKVIGVDTFGESAPAGDVYKAFGITADAVSRAAHASIAAATS